jgi:ATP synthase protein I
MPLDPNSNRNDELTPGEQHAKGFTQQIATAMELPFVLVGTIVLGGLTGFFLDRWLHTKPFLMLILGALGFIAGVRDVLRRLPNK